MGPIEEITEEMAAYVCDNLCKYRNDSGIGQGRLESLCRGCPLEVYIGSIKECAGAAKRLHMVETA